MPLEINLSLLGDEFVDKARITQDGRFLYPADEEITTGDLLNLVYHHQDEIRPKLEMKYNYYVGKHPILDRPKKEPYKPDNRIIINFPRKAVTSFNGFFAGTPVKIDHEDNNIDEWIKKWRNRVNFEDVFSEVSKMSSMYGHAYFYVYQADELDQNGKNQTLIAPLSPLNSFLIYDDTFGEQVRYGVMYRYNSDHKLEITLFEKNSKRILVESSSPADLFDQAVAYANPYPIIPIVDAPENSERMALCEDVFNLVDAQNKAMSEKADAADYFDDAYLKFINAHVDPEDVKEIHDNRVIVVEGEESGNSSVEFMSKPDADATEEHLIDRLVDNMYQIANVTNLNDDQFAGNPSGVSLKLKFQAMSNMAQSKALKFQKALRSVFECVFAVSGDVDGSAWWDLEFKFTQAIPENLSEEAQIVNQLYGKISNHTLFKQLSFIDDPDKEMEQIEKEQQDGQAATAGLIQQVLAAQTDQQKAGVTNADDNGGAGTKADKSVDQAGRQIQQAK